MTPDLFIAKWGPGGPAFALNEEQGAQSTGLPHRVSFSEAQLVGKAGSTFTHNHPGNASFSPDDYGQALFAGLHELRAVTPQFRRVLVLTDKVPSAQVVGALRAQLTAKLLRPVQGLVTSDQLPSGALLVALQHQFWVSMARSHGLKYFREPS